MINNIKYQQKIEFSERLIQISWILAVLLPFLSVIIAQFIFPHVHKLHVNVAVSAIFLFPVSMFLIIALMLIISDAIKRDAKNY